MNYRRGFFRLWVVATVPALIGVWFWVQSDRIHAERNVDTCPQVTELHLKNPQSVLAGLQLPVTMCTHPEHLLDYPDQMALERHWTDIESVKVVYERYERRWGLSLPDVEVSGRRKHGTTLSC